MGLGESEREREQRITLMFSFSQADIKKEPPIPHIAQAPLTMAEREDADADAEAWLPLKPVEPLPSQCCGSGCSPCVFDLYYRDLERWETAKTRNDRSLLSGEQPPESQVRSPEW